MAQKYVPTEYDIEWTRRTIRNVSHGGVVQWDDARLRYRVDHQKRTLTLVNVNQLKVAKSNKLHECTRTVCAILGYTVQEADVVTTQTSVTVTPDRLQLSGDNPRGK